MEIFLELALASPQGCIKLRIRYTQAVSLEHNMAHPSPDDEKIQALRKHGTLNPHPEKVTDPAFQADPFFDPRDLAQVKYEMVRRVDVDRHSVTGACAAFGISRPAFYKAKTALRCEGLAGLLPRKRGPHGGHKLTDEVLQAIDAWLADDPTLGPEDLATRARDRFGLTVHPRSIQRARLRRKKKRP